MSELPGTSVTIDDPLDLEVDALVVPVFRGAIEGPGAEQALQALGLDEVPRDAGFRGDLGQVQNLAAPGLACGRVVLVGMGRMDELDTEQLRRAAGSATRALLDSARSLATTLPLVSPAAASIRAVAEGTLLGAYRYRHPRAEARPARLTEIVLVVPSSLGEQAQPALARARLHARAQCAARDLVATPPGDLGPAELVAQATELCSDGVEIEVWDETRLAEEGCGGLLAVGRGSARPPRLLALRYRPAADREPLAKVALVGKGITFDSGGISLKRPWQHMTAMKGDMGGAAAVIGALSVLAELDLPVEVLGLCAIAENLPSGDAQRPTDVITIRGGTTVEVRNTDAEGRLVLADALVYAAEQDPDAIVDVATLTGAAIRAIGPYAMATFANDDDLLRQVLTAAEEAGEDAWHLPLWDDLRADLDSEIADLANVASREDPGATHAGLFLREFVDGLPWVHLDIAGPSWADEERHHLPKQGTGAAVRTLLHWLEQTTG